MRKRLRQSLSPTAAKALTSEPSVSRFASVVVWVLLIGSNKTLPHPPVAGSTRFGTFPAAIRSPRGLPEMDSPSMNRAAVNADATVVSSLIVAVFGNSTPKTVNSTRELFAPLPSAAFRCAAAGDHIKHLPVRAFEHLPAHVQSETSIGSGFCLGQRQRLAFARRVEGTSDPTMALPATCTLPTNLPGRLVRAGTRRPIPCGLQPGCRPPERAEQGSSKRPRCCFIAFTSTPAERARVVPGSRACANCWEAILFRPPELNRSKTTCPARRFWSAARSRGGSWRGASNSD